MPDNEGKNTVTHSYYLILTAFPWQPRLCKCTSLLR